MVEVDGVGLTLDQAGQAAARRLQALLLQDLADAGVHACIPEAPEKTHLHSNTKRALVEVLKLISAAHTGC